MVMPVSDPVNTSGVYMVVYVVGTWGVGSGTPRIGGRAGGRTGTRSWSSSMVPSRSDVEPPRSTRCVAYTLPCLSTARKYPGPFSATAGGADEIHGVKMG